MIAAIQPSKLTGRYSAPPSKSDSHRALIGAALADGFSHVAPVVASADVEATRSALEMLEAKIQIQDNLALVQGISRAPAGHVRIHCNESGSSLRFLIPIAAAFGIEAVFTGSGKLPQRPLGVYHELFPEKGVRLKRLESDELPLKVTGQLHAGRFLLPGNVSSQFITGLMFALPLLDGDSELVLTSLLESRPYVDMTISALARFGVAVEETGQGYRIAGNQRYTPCTYRVEGDYSNAAFFAAAGLLSEQGVVIDGLAGDSRQGDREILDLLRRFGGRVSAEGEAIRISRGKLLGIQIDASQIPDLVPILSVVGAFAEGETRIYNAHRLKLKESDRLVSTTEALRALGADALCDDDSITVRGGKMLHSGVVSACNDHRIAMSAAVAALFCDGEVLIDGAEAVNKSYPQFYDDYNRLGGRANVRMG